jgi:hypothetical protein
MHSLNFVTWSAFDRATFREWMAFVWSRSWLISKTFFSYSFTWRRFEKVDGRKMCFLRLHADAGENGDFCISKENGIRYHQCHCSWISHESTPAFQENWLLVDGAQAKCQTSMGKLVATHTPLNIAEWVPDKLGSTDCHGKILLPSRAQQHVRIRM